ncbi:MAG: DUF2935 domain-containing protein [Allosphingosinicella sp.]|uniref:DUF2935 domain-containing protein n=1 Tax=Allosphingosinicella sp. TaxID=2823234 RepID=UPI0039339188
MTEPEAAPADIERTEEYIVSRRGLVELAGVTLISATFFATSGCAALGQAGLSPFPRVDTGPIRPQAVSGAQVGTLNGGTKPIYVTRPGSRDPVEHSVADTLFWGEQMMEHAMFFVMLMPGPDLARPRGQAEQFQRQFADHLMRLRASRLDQSNYAALNGTTVALARRLIDYKREMEQAQTSGRYRTLVWPTFFDHTRGEAERFVRRLEQLNRGDTSYQRAEVVPFWSDKMAEHAQFIAHLLDPQERLLIGAAEQTSETFRGLENEPGSASVAAAVQDIIDFKTAAERGIQTGQIRSIIHPALADHVRREAVRFQDELMRAV